MLNRLRTGGAIAGICLTLALVSAAGTARAAPPGAPTITEPVAEGQIQHPADVHMEANGFADPDGGVHQCSNWQIQQAGQVVWRSACADGPERIHIHLGDGEFVGSLSGRNRLEYGQGYLLRVRFRDTSGEWGPFSQRGFATSPQDSKGGAVAWTPVQPGFVVEELAGGLRLPVNVAFVPNPGPGPKAPLLYVAELYGTIKVITRDWTVSNYATGLLNFNPTGDFPGSGEQGLTGLVVQPGSGDVFASLVHRNQLGPHYPRVIRLHSDDGGRTASSSQVVLDMQGETQGPSHQISNLSLGPDGKLYVHNGDGFEAETALDLDSFRGKILRLDPDGSAPADNPFYDELDGIGARDYVYAYGFRNPFGGAWRASNGGHYTVENGPLTDRMAAVRPGFGYGWDGNDETMTELALYNWAPSHAPVNIAFVQPETFNGSRFPASKQDHAFVTESGPTYATGPVVRGKRIVEFWPGFGGEPGGHPRPLVAYTGRGQATAAGLAAGPRGLYFTDLYRDHGAASPTDPGARLLRVRYAGVHPLCTVLGQKLLVSVRRGRSARIRQRKGGLIAVNGRICGAGGGNIDEIRVRGSRGDERVTIDLSGRRLGPGATPEPRLPEVEISVSLGRGDGDTVAILGSGRRDSIRLLGSGARLNRDGDRDVFLRGVERLRVSGRGGRDLLRGGPRGELFEGGPGPDRLLGGPGPDLLLGGRGPDLVLGGPGFDRLGGGPGTDRCFPRRRESATSCER